MHLSLVAIRTRAGSVLLTVMILTVIAAILLTSLLSFVSHDGLMVQDDQNYTLELYMDEGAINWISENLWIGYAHCHPAHRLEWLDANWQMYNRTQWSPPGGDYPGAVQVRAVARYLTQNPDERVIIFEAVASSDGGARDRMHRTLTKAISYGLGRSRVFDYVYFINNFGWFWGSTISANGDVRANGNFSNKYNPKINGDAWGSENSDVGAAGTVDGSWRHDNLTVYRDAAEPHWRPTQPEAASGYDGLGQGHPGRTVLEMPFLDDISRYETLAQDEGGSITIDGEVVVNAVAPTNTVLIGTADHPIEIHGPVVIKGDLAIKGVIRGQGTIYTERNVHVVGDITYEKQPKWSKEPGASPMEFAEYNRTADFLGLAARGSVILGDYTNGAWNVVKNYIKPPFTKPYTDEDGSQNNGDYTAVDGIKADGAPRRRYESSWSDHDFKLMATAKIKRIDALAYTNHLYGGRAATFVANGAIISRDEAIIFDQWLEMNYDYRARESGDDYIDIDLPRAARMDHLLWFDGSFESMEERGELARLDLVAPEL